MAATLQNVSAIQTRGMDAHPDLRASWLVWHFNFLHIEAFDAAVGFNDNCAHSIKATRFGCARKSVLELR